MLCIHIGRVEWAGGALAKRGEFVAFPESLHMQPYAQAHEPRVNLALMAAGPLRRGLSNLNAAPASQGGTYRCVLC